MFWSRKENVYNALAVEGLKPGDKFFMIELGKVIECRVEQLEFELGCRLTRIKYQKPVLRKWPREKMDTVSEKVNLDKVEVYRSVDDCMNKRPMPKVLFDAGKLLERHGWEIEKNRKDGDVLWYYYWDGASAVKESCPMRRAHFIINANGVTVKANRIIYQAYRTQRECESSNEVEVMRLNS